MPLNVQVVTKPVRNSAQISPPLVPGARVLAEFRRSGLLARISKFHLDRRSGAFDVLSIFAFATVFFLAGPTWGLQALCRSFGGELRRIARLAGLAKLPSAGALSRGLSAVDRATAVQVSDALLVDVPDMVEVLSHPSVLHRDSHGDSWHVVDFDPTITAFRLRDLPSGEDLGPATRRAPGVPGYTGHKRGERRIRHMPLMHAGTGFWLAYRLEEPGCPSTRTFRQLLVAARPWWARLGGVDRMILRFDGEFGHVGGFRACRDEGVHAIGRMARYTLLERPEIQAAVEAATWHTVPSSDAAKPTEAADLGWVKLFPAEGAVDAEEGPVEVRVVLSRLRPTEGHHRHGVMVAGYQVEMFGTDLPPEAWPPEEVVSLYRGRAVIENRFAQEDREFATERTLSFHLWGQALMVAIAMALWNFLIGEAFRANPPPMTAPRPVARPVMPEVSGPPLLFPPSSSPAPQIPPSDPSPDAQTALPISEHGDGGAFPGESPIPEVQTDQQAPPPASVVETEPRAVDPKSPPAPGLALDFPSLVAAYFGDIATQPGWALNTFDGTVTCSYGTTFRLTYVDRITKKQGEKTFVSHRLILANPSGACNGCPQRSACFGSSRTEVSKRIARTVPADIATKVAEVLAAQRRPVAAHSPSRLIHRVPQQDSPASPLFRPLLENQPGPWRASFPSFLPAAARHLARRALDGLATLRIQRTAPPQKPHPLVEEDRAVRQHQRQSRRRPTGQAQVTLRVVPACVGPVAHWSCE